MSDMVLAAPILPGKLDAWKEFSRNLEEVKRSEFAALIKKTGLSRIRCWLQEGPDSAIGIIFYEGGNPEAFFKEIGSSQESFAVWFRETVMDCHGMDLSNPAGPPPVIVTDVSV